MRKRKGFIIALSVLALGIAIVVVVRTTAQRERQQTLQQRISELEDKESRRTIRLRERAELARARGQQRIVIPGVASLYPTTADVDELDQLLPRLTVVIAEPISAFNYIDDSGLIRSWHKFRVIQTISQAPPLPTYVTRVLPTELSPVAENEILIHREGGTVVVDGVEITSNEEGAPPFRSSQRYLLVLSLDPITRIGEIRFGAQSILPINANNTLDAGRDEHILQRALRMRHNGSMNQLRDNLRGRTSILQ